jgi:mannose-6-phosphate isomerase-like protein (cupin superfamily)
MEADQSWQSMQRKQAPDGVALDGASIWLLPRTPFSSAIYCELTAGATSRATYNSWIHEIWYFVSGVGEMARWEFPSDPDPSAVVAVSPGLAVTIPPGVNFQYRSTDDATMSFVCAVAPPWPDPAANHLSKTQMWQPTLPD